jgi:hypothetical protein
MAVTAKPRDFKRSAIEEVAIPLPIPDITPPDTNMYFVLIIYKKKLHTWGAYLSWVSLDFARDLQPAVIFSK